MPTPEHEARQPSVSAVSMKDLLASCAAATAVSTPPREEYVEKLDDLEDAEGTEDSGRAGQKDGSRRGRRPHVQPPARRNAA